MRIVQSGQSGVLDVGVLHSGRIQWYSPEILYTGWTGLPSNGHNVVATLYDLGFTRIRGVQASLYWGGSSSAEVGSTEWAGDQPVPIPYTAERDRKNYGSTIANLFSLDAPVDSFAREKGVKHLSTRGTLFPGTTDLYDPVRVGGNFPNWGWTQYTQYGSSQRFVGSDFSNGVPQTLTGVPLEPWLSTERSELEFEFNRLGRYEFPFNFVGEGNTAYPGYTSQDLRIAGHYQPYSGWYFGDHVFEYTGNTIDIGNVVFIPGWVLRYIRIKHELSLSPLPVPAGNYPNGAVMYRSVVKTTGVSYLCFNTPEPGPDGINNWGIQQSIPFSWTTTSDPVCIPLTDVTFSRVPMGKSLSVVKRFTRERHRDFQQSAPLLRPSSLQSFTDAMSHFKTTQANYVEALLEAGEIFSLLPSLVGAVRAFLSAKPSSLLGAVRSIGDLLSSMHLLVSFGFKPTVSNAEDINRMIHIYGPILRALQADVTLHGNVRYSFSELTGAPKSWYGAVLETRTKVRLKGLDNDFVIKLFQLDALGILPTSARLWDPIPFSFFVDYFLNMGDRYEAIDACITAALRGVHYCVHSYTVYDDTRAALLKHHLTSDDYSVKHYFREVSRSIPMLFGGEIDYNTARGPNRSITAALLWQFLQG